MFEPHMMIIPKGDYILGVPSPATNVLHRWTGPRKVSIESFMMAETSVTVKEFKCYLMAQYDEIPVHFQHVLTQADDVPAGGISWLDAISYVKWLRVQTNKPYRLPGSDEWEAAARGGLVGKRYPWGDAPPDGRCDSAVRQGGNDPMPVKSFEPNGYHLYDMSGNIWNWCSDLWIQHSLDEEPVNTPTGMNAQLNVILRGGSYMTTNGEWLMCAYVHEDPPDLRHVCLGMRVACDNIDGEGEAVG